MDDRPRFTFRKAERLCSKKRIEGLFASGRSLSAFPVRVVYQPLAPEAETDGFVPDVQVLVSVSKRHFKHAVDRNRLKRLIREAYRLNKHLLLTPLQGRRLSVAFIWMSGEKADFHTVEARMKNLLQRIVENERIRNEGAAGAV